MDAKFRWVYLPVAGAGLIYLVYTAITTFPDIDVERVLLITIPDMLFFFLAYRTYPEIPRGAKKHSIIALEHQVIMVENRVGKKQ
jgi:hypothetical protein